MYKRTMQKTLYFIVGFLWGLDSFTSWAQVPAEAHQLIQVLSPTWHASAATLQRWQRVSGTWQQVGPAIAVNLGYNGLGWGIGLHTIPEPTDGPHKYEGDRRAPAGIFSIGSLFGSDPLPSPYLPISSFHRCVDDPESAYYNRIVDLRDVTQDWKSAEIMLRKDGLYRIGAVIEHNTTSTLPRRGSCIFFHIWRGPNKPTLGCTSMASDLLESLITWLDYDQNPILVQLPIPAYYQLKDQWHLP